MKNIVFSGLFLFWALSMGAVAYAQNDHYPQFMEMGNRAYNNQKYDLAIDYYQSAIDDKDDCWQAYVGLGNCAFYQKKYRDALKNYEKAYKINPDSAELARFVAYLRNRLGVVPTPTPAPRWAPAPLPALAPLPPLGPLTPLPRP
jgi:tetratricopeptide (TPR) repeat protein